MVNNKIVLTCNPLYFYSKNDELLMTQWLKKIKCISKIDRSEDSFFLHIILDAISYNDFNNLIGLFTRYKFNRNQLKSFIREEDKDLLEEIDNPRVNHQNIYPYREQEKVKKEEIVLKCTPLEFYTKFDEDLMFRLIRKIKCIDKHYGIRNILYLCISPDKLSKKDFADLCTLFARYQFDEKQLAALMNI